MMSALIPIISEIIPMMMPSSARIIKARDIDPPYPTVEGPVIQRPAVVGKCDKMCASVLTIRPKSVSSIRHNSEQEAIIYTTSGTGILLINEGLDQDLKRHELSQGDFAVIPSWTEHQFKNDSEEDVVFVVFQGGSSPVGAYLKDWGGDEVKMRK